MAGARTGAAQDKRFFADGGFFTPDRKARFIAPEPPALRETANDDISIRLNTGRVRDQWHTMTRTGLSPRLGLHSCPSRSSRFIPTMREPAWPSANSRGCTTAYGRVHLQGVAERGPAARVAVRADPLERRDRLFGARLRTGRAAHRPVLGPAGGERQPASAFAGRIRLSRFRAHARSRSRCRTDTWWSRVTRRRRPRLSASRPTTSRSFGAHASAALMDACANSPSSST